MFNNLIKNYRLKWKNANAVIDQLNNNEWRFKYNEHSQRYLTAYRKGRELWIGSSGAWFLTVDSKNVFGHVLKHYVWWMAVRKALKKVNKKHKETNILEIDWDET